jgi:hypothetical protein
MALSAAQLSVDFTTTGADPTERDIRRVGNAVQDTDRKGSGFLKGAFSTMTGFLGAGILTGIGSQVVNLGKSFIFGASDTAEAQSQVNQVFGESSGVVSTWADSAAKAFGVSRAEALSTAGAMGNLFTNMGFGRDVAATMSTSMIGLSGDMASFFNISSPEAINAITSAFVGEYDALQRLGIPINAAAVEQYALNNGIWDGVDAMTEAERATAVYGLVLENTSNVQGDYARTSDGMANRVRTLQAMFSNLAAKIGAGLLPAATALTGWAISAIDIFGRIAASPKPFETAMTELQNVLFKAFGRQTAAQIMKFVRDLISGFQKIVSVGRQVASAIKGIALDGLMNAFGFLADHGDTVKMVLQGVAIGLGVVAAASLVAAAATGVLAGVMAVLFSPITLIVAAIAGLYVAYQTNFLGFADGVRAAIDFLMPGIQALIGLMDALKAAFAADGWSGVWDTLRTAASAAFAVIKSAIGDIVSSISNIDWGGFLSGAWSAIQTGLQFAWDAITSIDWSQFIPNVDWAGILGKAGDIGVKLFNHIKSFITDVDWMDLFTKAGSIGAQIGGHIVGLITAVDWKELFTKAGSLAGKVGDHITGLIAAVDWKELFTRAGSLASKIGDHIVSLIGSVDWKELFTKGGSLASKVGDHIIGLIASVDWLQLFTKAGEIGGTIAAHIVSLIASVDWLQLFTRAAEIGGAVASHIISLITAVDWMALFTKAGSLAATVGGHIVSLITAVDWKALFTKAGSLGATVGGHIVSLITAVDWKALFTKAGSLGATVGGHITSLIASVDWTAIFTKAAEIGTGFLGHIKSLVTSVDWTALFGEAIDVAQGLLDWITGQIDIPDFPGWPSREEILAAIVNAAVPGNPMGGDDGNGTTTGGDNDDDGGGAAGGTIVRPSQGRVSAPIDFSGLAGAKEQLAGVAGAFAALKAAYDVNIPPISLGFQQAPPTWSIAPTASLAAIQGAFNANLMPLPPITQAAFGGAQAVAAAASAGMQAAVTANTSTMRTNATSASSGMQAAVSANANTMKSNVSLAMAGTQMAVALQSAAMAAAVKVQGLVMVQSATSSANAMRQVLTAGAAAAAAGVSAGLGRIPGIVSSVGGQAVGVARGIGANIGSAFASGMESQLGRIQAAANAMVSAAATAMIAKAIISSPSKLFYGIAKWIPRGVVGAIRDGIPSVTTAIGDMFSTYSHPAAIGGGIGLTGPPMALGGYGTAPQVSHVTHQTLLLAMPSEEWLEVVRNAEAGKAAPERVAALFKKAKSLTTTTTTTGGL